MLGKSKFSNKQLEDLQAIRQNLIQLYDMTEDKYIKSRVKDSLKILKKWRVDYE